LGGKVALAKITGPLILVTLVPAVQVLEVALVDLVGLAVLA
jgi:hypothetical protein